MGKFKNAEKVNLKPLDYINPIAKMLKSYGKPDIEYDDFIRTTEERYKVVAKIFERFIEQGDIYKGVYEFYCTSCESFFTETQVEDGRCPDCHGPVNS